MSFFVSPFIHQKYFHTKHLSLQKMLSDEFYMSRCLHLAQNALGNTYPNPLVGAILVYNNEIIAEGFHTKAGLPHAEIEAINQVKNKSIICKSTLYVNLEPCSHYGKTPPCAETIARLGIPRVVIGTIDTTSKVNGKGIEILRNAGIEVKVGVLEAQARYINRRFFTFHEKKRPYIILKWAQSADGFIDIDRQTFPQRQSYPITSLPEQIFVHKLRSTEQAILVGPNTIINDNPQLTSRYYFGNNPVRITYDLQNNLPSNSYIFDDTVPTIIFNTSKNEALGKQTKFLKIFSKNQIFGQIFDYLYKENIQSILIEGGKKTLDFLIQNDLFDEVFVFVSNKFLGNGLNAPIFSLQNCKKIKIGNSILLTQNKWL